MTKFLREEDHSLAFLQFPDIAWSWNLHRGEDTIKEFATYVAVTFTSD